MFLTTSKHLTPCSSLSRITLKTKKTFILCSYYGRRLRGRALNKLFSETDLMVIDDLFLRKKVPEQAADDLLDIILNRYASRKSTLLTSNRPIRRLGTTPQGQCRLIGCPRPPPPPGAPPQVRGKKLSPQRGSIQINPK